MNSKNVIRVLGVRQAAAEAGVSKGHISLVARGLRKGSKRVEKAVQEFCRLIYAVEQ